MKMLNGFCVACRWSLSIVLRREGNEVANVLARHAKNVVDEVFWLEDSPPPAVSALYLDSINI